MSKDRNLPQSLWTWEAFVMCSEGARLTYIAMKNFCDDSGIHEASIFRLKTEIYPWDVKSPEELIAQIEELIKNGLLTEYEVEYQERVQKYWRIVHWEKFQKMQWPSYKYPFENGVVPSTPDRSLRKKDKNNSGINNESCVNNTSIIHKSSEHNSARREEKRREEKEKNIYKKNLSVDNSKNFVLTEELFTWGTSYQAGGWTKEEMYKHHKDYLVNNENPSEKGFKLAVMRNYANVRKK